MVRRGDPCGLLSEPCGPDTVVGSVPHAIPPGHALSHHGEVGFYRPFGVCKIAACLALAIATIMARAAAFFVDVGATAAALRAQVAGEHGRRPRP